MYNSRMNIQRLDKSQAIPWDLLLLADPSKKLVEEYVKDGLMNVAIIDNKIVAEYVLLDRGNGLAEVMNIAVDEKFQGQGIGKQLLMHAIKTAKYIGFKIVEIGTSNASHAQLALYQKCGFKIYHIKKNFFVDNYDEEIYDNGVKCVDMIMLSCKLNSLSFH